MRAIKSTVIKGSDAVTVVSRAMAEEAVRLGADCEMLGVLPMGVDLTGRFVPGAKREDSREILFVGRLVEKKGARYLIEAMPEICRKFPEATLKIVGDGPEMGRLKAQCRGLEMTGNVDFLGSVENEALPGLYQNAAVVVFPSVIGRDGDREGFGLVLVEALGCECAVVTTDLPAMEDIITDGQTGLVVPGRNPGKIAEKVIYLLENPDMIERLGKAGRRFVLQHFGWDTITEQYRSLITSISC